MAGREIDSVPLSDNPSRKDSKNDHPIRSKIFPKSETMWIFVKPDNIWDISLYSFSFLFLFQIFFSFSIIIPVLTMEIEDNKKGKKKKKAVMSTLVLFYNHPSPAIPGSNDIGLLAIPKTKPTPRTLYLANFFLPKSLFQSCILLSC